MNPRVIVFCSLVCTAFLILLLSVLDPRLEIGLLERQLVNSYTANGIRMLLVKLAKATPGKPAWGVNSSWSIPLPIKSIVLGFSRSFLQDFTYILIGKSKELVAKNVSIIHKFFHVKLD